MEILDWEDIYVQLYAYSDQLLKAKTWFRKGGVDSYLKGKQVHDYISEAIERYLRNPEKYDLKFNRSLVNYLKQHIIRTLVGNDVSSVEDKISDDILSSTNDDSDKDDTYSNLDALLPYVDVFFNQDIDYHIAYFYVRSQLSNDEIALSIFDELCEGLKRRDTIETRSMSDAAYDNGVKRLHKVLKRTVAKYDLIQQQ